MEEPLVNLIKKPKPLAVELMEAKTLKVGRKPAWKKRNVPCVIGIDPGINNLGWCLVGKGGELLSWGMLTSTLEDLKGTKDIHLFKRNMMQLVKYVKCVTFSGEKGVTGKKLPALVMERYMPRGMRRGNQAERMNIIIGYLLARLKAKEVCMLPASSWKKHRNKHYFEVSNKTVPEHMVDTYTMVLYYLERVVGLIDASKVKKKLKVVQDRNWGWKKVKGVWVNE